MRVRNVHLPHRQGRDTQTDYSYLQKPKIRERYQAVIANKLRQHWNNNQTPNEMYSELRECMEEATKVIPKTTSRLQGIGEIEDEEIREWMKQRNHLKDRIQRASTVEIDQRGNILHWKRQRNHLSKRIAKRKARLQQDRIDALASDIERFKNTQKSYEAVRHMKGENWLGTGKWGRSRCQQCG
jgi:uncharacterized protein YdcH (DUF465 family)